MGAHAEGLVNTTRPRAIKRGVSSIIRVGAMQACLMRAMVFVVLAAGVHGCVVYEPVPVGSYPAPSKYDRVWDSALRAASDTGIAVAVADKPAGAIKGSRGAIAVAISVLRQGDGSVRVALDLKGPLDTDPGLSDRFYQAYDRYMGR